MDDASARSLLSGMQARLSRDPYEALGLVGGAAAPEVRNAFLSLTKQFHPAKFARMAVDVQKLANEVFLLLRAAHDMLSRPSVTPRTTGPVPTLRPPSTLRAPSQPNPTSRPGGTATATITQPMPRTSSAATVTQAMPRPGVAASRTITPLHTPIIGATAAPTATPGRLAQPSPAPASGSARPAPRPGASTPATGVPTADRELAAILQLIDVGQLAAARVALESLAKRSPTVRRYEALLHYAKGREAQLDKRIDEARVELQDALQIDPELQLAKTALAELFTRRK